MEYVCTINNGVPLNAMKIGHFKNGDHIFTCCDSRKDECKHYISYKGSKGQLMICEAITNCSKHNLEE